MGTLRKVTATVRAQYADRGLACTVLMNVSLAAAMLRGLFYRLLYFRNIEGSLFSMQGNSTIEMYTKRSKLSVGRFVSMRKNVSIRIDSDGMLSIGDKSFLNDNCVINCACKITIGRQAKIAPNVCINDHDHNYRSGSEQHLIKGEVAIGDHVWIGAGAVILRGTTIGDHAVIAAGSIVKGDVPAGTIFMNKREKSFIRFMDTDYASQAASAASRG